MDPLEKRPLKQQLESLLSTLVTHPYASMGEVFPLHVQQIVERSSCYRLSVASIDRHGNVFYPQEEFWNGMHHSFYRLQFKDDSNYHVPVGDFVIPQPIIRDVSSIVDCVRLLLEQYPLQGVAVRHEKSFIIPTGSTPDLEQHSFDVRVIPMNGGLPGRSILYGGNKTCDCSYECNLCEEEVIQPRAEYFYS